MASSHKPFIISLKFRSVLEKIEKKLSKKNLQEIAFVYEMGDHLKKENKINGLNLFHDIICEGKLDHSDGELISGLVEVLNNLQRTNLARLLIEYCSEWNICYEVSSDQQVSSNTATSTEHPEASVRMSMEQVQDITSTATDDTETSSGDEPQKTQKIVDTVILHRGRRPSKGRPKVNGGACSSSRKRKKQGKLEFRYREDSCHVCMTDVGALDERQLSMECYYQSCDEVDDQVEPHDSQDDQYMKQAMDEAKLSPDGDVQVCTVNNTLGSTLCFDVQVGTVIVNKSEGKVLGRGHNRMPEGCDSLPWGDNEHDPLNSKYPYGKCVQSVE